MKKFKVRYEYRGKVTVEVEAETAEDAEHAGLEEADESVELSVYDCEVEEIRLSHNANEN